MMTGIKKIGSVVTQAIQSNNIKNAKFEEAAQEAAEYLPGYKTKGIRLSKLEKRAMQINIDKAKEVERIAERNREQDLKQGLHGYSGDIINFLV